MDPDHLISQIIQTDIKQTDDSNCFAFITDTFDDLCKPKRQEKRTGLFEISF